MFTFTVSETWKTAYPGASVGVLVVRDVTNPDRHAALDRHKAELEAQLRARFTAREQIKALETIQAYSAYYKRFKKTYHVQLQLESVALKDRSIPRVAALVEAMFAAELQNQLLTAGHDLDVAQPPVGVDVARGAECYTRIDGQEQELKAGDMFIADAQGVLSSVIYGPDQRTRITSATRRALFTVYAPPGIRGAAVEQHLRDIQANVLLIAPKAETELLRVYGTG